MFVNTLVERTKIAFFRSNEVCATGATSDVISRPTLADHRKSYNNISSKMVISEIPKFKSFSVL